MDYDAIIIGGSYSGISAGMQLARARRKIAVIDGGQRRNRFASASHGFLGQDGRAPGDIAADAKAQLLAYPTVDWIDGKVLTATQNEQGFAVTLADGTAYSAKVVVLALGVHDTLPETPGLAERWGQSVFHCPYCHGYELDQGEIGVLATSPASVHQGLLLPEWGPTTYLLNSVAEPDASELAQLEARGVRVERQPVVGISGRADVELADGRVLSFAGLFTASRTSPSSDIASQLRCRIEASPFGTYIWTDEMKQTSVSGVIACGDAGRMMSNVAMAVGDGALAGSMAHRALIFG